MWRHQQLDLEFDRIIAPPAFSGSRTRIERELKKAQGPVHSDQEPEWNRGHHYDDYRSQGRSTPYIVDGHPTFNRESL